MPSASRSRARACAAGGGVTPAFNAKIRGLVERALATRTCWRLVRSSVAAPPGSPLSSVPSPPLKSPDQEGNGSLAYPLSPPRGCRRRARRPRGARSRHPVPARGLRTQVVVATGSVKPLVAAWSAHELQARRALVLVSGPDSYAAEVFCVLAATLSPPLSRSSPWHQKHVSDVFIG